MRNSRPKKRQRRQRRSSTSADDSDSSFTVATPATNSRKNRRQTAAEVDFAEENSNDSASAEYRTRSGRKSSHRVGITVARTVPKKKKIGRSRKLDIYRSEDEDEEDEVVDYGHHFEEEEEEEEEEVRLSEEDSPNEDEVEEEEEVEENVSDEILSKKRLRSAREAPAALFMDNVEVPELTLPPSSEDLLIKGRNLMRTISIYEILRRFQQNLRLTPFRFEDFCVSLLIDEQTYLLSEIHIQLLKALIREDDLVGMQHGPQDVRDAINIYLYLCDPMTWPEVTRIYLSTDYKKNAKLFNDSLAVNYPFASLEQKLILLEYFCEEFLTSASCREVLNNEGTIKHDDNCRGCHRTGDLLCCDTCPAVFHLGCLDPPLKQVPEDVWTCPICNLNSVTGVTDCVSDLERLGYCSRQEPIGWDRHGRKYWFLCRRLIVEDQKDADQVAYYSSRLQFDELLASLDAEHYESDLCAALAELKEEIYRQMQITEKLTKMAKGTRKSFLEAINEELFFKREAKLKAKIAEAEEAEEKAAIEEQLADLETKLAVDENDKRSHQIDGSGVLTRLKTGSIQPKTVSMDSFKNRISSYNNFSAVRDEETVILLKDNLTLTRELRKTLPTSYLAMNLFKLGMEGNYRQYQNIYSVNKFALNKAQLAEECDKKRHLSHKFSLTEASELKWTPQTTTSAHSAPSIHGTRIMMVNILRQTLLNLETQLTLTFMHPNWSVHRSNWIKAVTMCSEAKEFLLAMHILESSMKPVLFNIAWHDSLGFSVLQPSTQAERDKLKKREKKDRKEGGGGGGGNANESMAVDSSEPSSAAGRFNGAGIGVRLVCGKLKHQIWKQKGEEFRLSGIGGWQWVSSTRVRPQEALGATGKKEEEKEEEEELATEEAMEATDDMEPSVINISAALSDETPAKDRKYSKVTSSPSSSRLDSLLKTRLDLYAFYKRQEKEAATATADATSAAADKKAEEEQKTAKTANSGGFSTYRCYSAICHSTGQLSSSQQLKCYSPLCIYHHQKATNSSVKEEATEAVVEKLSPLDDPAEHVELLEVKAVGGANVPVPIRKIVPFKSVLPPATRFMVGKYKSMLILPLYEMRKLGRNGGLREVIGFNYVCKSNNVNWPYGQTPRPSLRLMWLWRTACLGTLHAVAHQLRVLWAAVRWDDIQYMLTKPPSSSSVKTITTESEVTTVEILRRRDLPPFGLRSQYLMRKIIVPIDLPSTPSCEVSTPIRSGLRQRKRPVSPPVKGPRMEEIWLNEEELELWEIRQFAERAIMEERKRQAELRQKAAAELRKSNASTPISANRAQLVNGARNSTTTPTTTPTTNSPLNINTKQAISSRLSSIFQNRAANRVLASASPVVNSGTITPTTTTTTYATIRTANGTFRVPVHNKPGAPPNQLFLRTGGQIITSSSTAAAQQGSTSVIQGGNVIVTSNAVSGSGGITPTRPGTYIVRVPANAGAGGGLGTAKPLIISNVGSWSNGALPDIVRGGNPNIKQAVPLIEPKGPQKISTGTTVNAIQATSSSSSSAAKSTTPAQSTAAVTTTTGAINIVTPLSTTPTIGKGIQCVQLKTSDGRTHLLPISSLPTAPGQTFQIALNSGGSGTPLRLITTSTAVNNKPVDNGKGQTTYMISAGSSAFVPGANGGQKVILQQQQSANSITSTNSTTVTPATDSSFKVMVEPTTAGSSAKTNLVTAPATTATTTALITSSSSKPAALAPPEPPKAFELTPEVTQEIVRKALMDASLPHGTSQKLLAYQKRHRQLNKLDGGAAPVGAASADDDDGGDHDGSLGSNSSTSKSKKQIGASGRSGSYYASATSRLMDSVSSSSRPSRISSAATSSRSSRPSRGNSRYDNSDFFTDFTPASKKHLDRSFAADEEDGGLEKGMMTGDDEFDALDQVDRVCAGVLNGLLKKVEKGEKMARRAELREERNQKLVVASRLKYRQSHIEVMRRSIERRKAQLNISIRLHVEEKLNGQFTKEEEEAAAPKSKSVKKRKLTDADHVDADTPPTSKQANRGGGKAAKRPKVTVISQSPPSSFPATNSISHNDDNDTADAAATVIGQTPKPSQARMKTTRSKLNGSTTSSTTSSNSITTAAKLSKNFSSIRQTKKAMKAQSRVDICQVTSESSESSAAATASPATYCICQQAYDANKFYICCDRCQGWFHGRCVGITSVVAETIDDYICPQCEGDNSINYRNIKELSAEDYQALMKIVKSIQGHVQAQPFLRPVCKKKVPDYYTVIEEPMDLKTIETRLKNKIYKSFAELNYDMNKIFDNCLIYNGRTSHYSHYAETLKENFNELVDEFRENDR